MRNLILTLLLTSAMANAQLATKKSLTLDAAKKIAEAAHAEAVANKWTMVIAIVDDGGNLVYLERADGTQIGSVDVAQEKAKSAVKFKRSTKVFEDAVAGGRNAILKLPGALPVEGGVPLMIDGVVLGAIGVSGATSAQDGQCAAAGLKVFEKLAK
jgi:glc operon protein GlcG